MNSIQSASNEFIFNHLEVNSLHPLMNVTDVVCIIFEYTMSIDVCMAFSGHEQGSFYIKMKEKYQNLHDIPVGPALNSLNFILLSINGNIYDSPRQYCLEAFKKIKDFVKNKLIYEIDTLKNNQIKEDQEAAKRQYFNSRMNFLKLIPIKKVKLQELVNTASNLCIDQEFSILNKELERSYLSLQNVFNLKTLDTTKKLLADATSDFRHVRILVLIPNSESEILTVLPHEIGHLLNLQTLDISNNRIQYLPDSINNLTNLTCLKAPNNNLQQLPLHFPAHPNFTYIDLDNNKLGNINYIFPSIRNIETLGISFQWQGLLSDEIKAFSRLKELHFDNLDLLFPFLEHFLQSPLNIKIFTTIAYLEANAHLLTLNISNDNWNVLPEEKKRWITIDSYREMPLNDLIKIKNHKDALEKQKNEEFEKEKKLKEGVLRNQETSRTCIIS